MREQAVRAREPARPILMSKIGYSGVIHGPGTRADFGQPAFVGAWMHYLVQTSLVGSVASNRRLRRRGRDVAIRVLRLPAVFGLLLVSAGCASRAWNASIGSVAAEVPASHRAP